MNANITVLKDENLGGIEREYREVKRKAAVGERIKIVDEDSGYAIGTLFTVTDADYDWGGGGRFRDGTGVEVDGGVPLFHERYLALEPTDIVRIDSARFRMVDRKAAVGERVIVTDVIDNYGFFSRGNIGIYKGDNWVDFNDQGNVGYDTDDGEWAVGGNNGRSGYRVLEPVEIAEQPEPLSAKPAPDQAAEIIVALTSRVTALEKRVAALETAEVTEKSSREVADSLSAILAKGERVIPLKSAQEIRDDIVRRAKEDLEGVKTPWNINADPKPLVYVFRQYVVDVEFIVNREKRTVVAIARWRATNAIVNKGIAKCAPGDVFNSHIGRAIALRRALGLEIPEEYVSAPQPTEIRVGDVVEGTSHSGAIGPVLEIGHDGEENFVIYRNDTNPSCFSKCWSGVTRVIILDDSRTSEAESDSAEPRKEVA